MSINNAKNKGKILSNNRGIKLRNWRNKILRSLIKTNCLLIPATKKITNTELRISMSLMWHLSLQVIWRIRWPLVAEALKKTLTKCLTWLKISEVTTIWLSLSSTVSLRLCKLSLNTMWIMSFSWVTSPTEQCTGKRITILAKVRTTILIKLKGRKTTILKNIQSNN